MKYCELLNEGKRILEEADIDDAFWDSWYLLEHLSGYSRADYLLHQKEEAAETLCTEYRELIEQRKNHKPLQYITGHQEFMGLDFLVTPDVLIPRQDTELIVEIVMKKVSHGKLLDMCTGSGCIGIALAKLGTSLKVTAVDASEAALAVAQKNSDRLDAGVTFILSDLFQNVNEKFNCIVSNPPYITEDEMGILSEEVVKHEPEMALWGGIDGLYFYREIIRQSPKYLESGGMLFFEIGYWQGEKVSEMMKENGYYHINVLKDYAGLDRIVYGILDCD